VVNQVDNFANIGKAVLLQSLGLQKNYSEAVESTVEVTDYNTTACASCKYCSIIRSFNPESDAYKSAADACLSCPHRVTATQTIYKKIYHNERNRYGYKPMLKSMAIKLLLLFHFCHPDQFGVIDSVSFGECAKILHCNPRTVHNNLEILASYGYISYSKNDSKSFSVCLNDYESYYLPASQGGRGYIVMSSQLLTQLLGIGSLMSLRIHLRELVELDNLSIQGHFTALNKTYSEMKRSLPSYCKPCVIKSCMKQSAGIFNITCKDKAIRFEIVDRFDCKRQKSELFDMYMAKFSDFIAGFNSNVADANAGSLIADKYRTFFDLSGKNFPADMTGSYCLLHISSLELEDLVQLSMQYSYDNVVAALADVYRDYCLREKTVNNLGALLRTIILAKLNLRGSPKRYSTNAA
jgi:hypothetical protein